MDQTQPDAAPRTPPDRAADRQVTVERLEDGRLAFTTNCREVADLFERVCEGANVTKSPSELNGFHWQGWTSRVQLGAARLFVSLYTAPEMHVVAVSGTAQDAAEQCRLKVLARMAEYPALDHRASRDEEITVLTAELSGGVAVLLESALPAGSPLVTPAMSAAEAVAEARRRGQFARCHLLLDGLKTQVVVAPPQALSLSSTPTRIHGTKTAPCRVAVYRGQAEVSRRDALRALVEARRHRGWEVY